MTALIPYSWAATSYVIPSKRCLTQCRTDSGFFGLLLSQQERNLGIYPVFDNLVALHLCLEILDVDGFNVVQSLGRTLHRFCCCIFPTFFGLCENFDYFHYLR